MSVNYLRFWYQVLTWVSVSPSLAASSSRSWTLRYFWRSKLFSSVCSWWSVKAVRALRAFFDSDLLLPWWWWWPSDSLAVLLLLLWLLLPHLTRPDPMSWQSSSFLAVQMQKKKKTKWKSIEIEIHELVVAPAARWRLDNQWWWSFSIKYISIYDEYCNSIQLNPGKFGFFYYFIKFYYFFYLLSSVFPHKFICQKKMEVSELSLIISQKEKKRFS